MKQSGALDRIFLSGDFAKGLIEVEVLKGIQNTIAFC
jgi:hypothetical protein